VARCGNDYKAAKILARLEDGRGGSAAHATRRVEGVDAEELVDEAAGDAEHHDLQPARGRVGLEGREAALGDVGELEVLRGGEVARDHDASLEGDDVEEAKHGGARR